MGTLRSLVPPRRIVTPPPPRAGERAPALPGDLDLGGRPALIAFLRHAGCPFAEATLRELRAAAAAAPDVAVVAVSHATPEGARAWCERAGGAGGVLLLDDPDRGAYATWGLGRSTLRHFAGARSLRAVARQARRGIRNTRPDGTRWQAAG
ncbi:MAG TPA: AhpC/TSA family protein, partial [Solirubrobacteraceae bacterium]|nr:AhpC/TSA family protein [Solirubrobacteraceae bacterium]